MFSKTDSKSRKAGGGVGAVERLDLSELHFAEVLPEGQYIDLPGGARRSSAWRVVRDVRRWCC